MVSTVTDNTAVAMLHTIRLRGGMMAVPNNSQPGGNQLYGTPRQDNLDLNRIPDCGVLDGIPRQFFKQTWLARFRDGLAGKTQDGYTMLAVYEGLDMGGPQWVLNNNALPVVPNAAAGGPVAGTIYRHTMTANEIKSHEMRDSRLLQILILHIEKDTPLRTTLQGFGTQGYVGACYTLQTMHVPNSPELESKLESIWANMSIESLNFKINAGTISKWGMIVLKFAKYFDTVKTVAQCKVTFMRGLPIQMLNIKNAETMRPDPQYQFPANYPNNIMAGVPHPNAGIAHPNAGEFDIMSFCTSIQSAWIAMLNAGSPEVDDSRDPNTLEFSDVLNDLGGTSVAAFTAGPKPGGPPKNKIPGKGGEKPFIKRKPKEMDQKELRRVCIKCGGIGHQAVWKLKNGTFSRCRTFNTLPDSVKKQLKYSHLGGISLYEIQQKVLKSGLKAEQVGMADIANFTELSDSGSSSNLSAESQELINFMGDMTIDEEEGDEVEEGSGGDDD